MDTLAPFIPLEEELQQPLAREYLTAAGNLATANLQESPDTQQGKSGSRWGDKEVHAFRAIPLLNLHPKRIVPEGYFPGDDNKAFVSACMSVKEAKIDDLKEFRAYKFISNPFRGSFEELAELITSYLSEESISRAYRRNTSINSVDTELSTSSNEDKRENVSSGALRRFVKDGLATMGIGLICLLKTVYIGYFTAEIQLIFRAGVKHVVINDGSIGVNFRGNHSGSDRSSEVPVISFECKPRHSGGIKRGSGEPETFVRSIFAQEVAQMIGSAIAQRTKVPIKLIDQEIFVMAMHGTLLYVNAAYFSPEYIEYIEKAPNVMTDPDKHLLWIRRSVHFDLKDHSQRVEALRFVWALVSYLASGNARSNIITAAITARGTK